MNHASHQPPRVLRMDQAAQQAAIEEIAGYLRGEEIEKPGREWARNHPSVPQFPRGGDQ